MLVSIRGEVFDLTSFAPHHVPGNNVVPTVSCRETASLSDQILMFGFDDLQSKVQRLGGQDLTDYFPVQVSALCNGVDGEVSPWVTLEASNVSSIVTDVAKYHDFRASTTDVRPDWYYESELTSSLLSLVK